jgi:NADP-dependent 3-hydroxy acid dehydrogenase YdfG
LIDANALAATFGAHDATAQLVCAARDFILRMGLKRGRFERSEILGKVVLITCTTNDTAETTATHLAARGAAVVLIAPDTERIRRLAASIDIAGGTACAVQADFQSKTSLLAAADQAQQIFGRVDVLINFAGDMPPSLHKMLDRDESAQLIDAFNQRVLYSFSAVLPQMKRQKSGQIINVASAAELRGLTSLGAWRASTKVSATALSQNSQADASGRIRIAVASFETQKPGIQGPKSQIAATCTAKAIAYAIENHNELDGKELTLTSVFGFYRPPVIAILGLAQSVPPH